MIKNLLPFLLLLLLLTGCNKTKSVVYFSSQPISNTATPEIVFQPSRKINFILLSNDEFLSNTVRMQIVKFKKDIPNYLGISIAQAKDFNVVKESKYLVGSFTLYEPSKYLVRFFGNNDNIKPMAEKYIFIEEN